jgi:hypothetical protein
VPCTQMAPPTWSTCHPGSWAWAQITVQSAVTCYGTRTCDVSPTRRRFSSPGFMWRGSAIPVASRFAAAAAASALSSASCPNHFSATRCNAMRLRQEWRQAKQLLQDRPHHTGGSSSCMHAIKPDTDVLHGVHSSLLQPCPAATVHLLSSTHGNIKPCSPLSPRTSSGLPRT